MADCTTDSPATLVCATTFAEVVATVTAKRQVNGETFIDVTYVGLDHSTTSTTLRLTDNATEEEILTLVRTYGQTWYALARQRIIDAGAWYAALDYLLAAPYSIPPAGEG